MTRSLGRVVLTCALAAAAVACGGPDRREFAEEMRAAMSRTPEWVERDRLGRRLWKLEQEFYEKRGYVPAWIDGVEPTPQLDALLQVLRDSELHGLEPAHYGTMALVKARAEADRAPLGASVEAADVPALDARLTYAYLQYAADLLGWRTSPREVDRNWLAAARKDDLAARLATAVDENRVRETLDELVPEHPQYKGLQAALARLRTEGALPVAGQKGGASVSWRIDRIRMNLERWRWVPRDLGRRHILVNVPAYQMQVVENGEPVLAMRVIVGKPDTPTPLFSDSMTYVVFSPYWNIPETILREETLPRLAEDPDYLARNNIEVVRGEEVLDPASIDWSDETTSKSLRFRQAPGPENALGLVKFIFPNNFSVYLHDTPTDALFNRERRTFSHGCIRVEKPVELAANMLRDQPQWTRARIVAAMQGQQESTVRLKSPVPVHIGYWTAWVEPDGRVTFTDDPYGLDRAQARLMNASVPSVRQNAG